MIKLTGCTIFLMRENLEPYTEYTNHFLDLRVITSEEIDVITST